MLFFALFICLISSTVLLAWWKGGGPERVVASMFLTAWLVSLAVYATEKIWVSVDWFGPLLNTALLLGLYVVAQRANRAWPILAASLQVLIVLAQVGRIIRPDWLWMVSMLITATWPYIQLTIVIIGTIFHWRREVRTGPEASWLSFSKGARPT